MEEQKKDSKILSRESWLKYSILIFICLIFGIPLCVKLCTADLNINLSNFSFESVLTLILSIFAMVLSAMFYFKTTQSSNDFYRDTFKFTKEISETLKGIEAGFGEKLKNIDKGYEDFRRSFENYMTPHEIETVKEEVKEEKIKLEEIVRQKDEIIKELEAKSNLSQTELLKYLQQIKEKEVELESKTIQLSMLKNRLEEDTRDSTNLEMEMRLYLRHRISKCVKELNLDMSDMSNIKYAFRKIQNEAHPSFLKDMMKLNLLTPEGNLTKKGIFFVKSCIE
jgi:hypothetical protein